MNRSESLDVFRLIAALAVITLHVSMGDIPLETTIYIRLLARFAVPFFFLVSGYFFYLGTLKSGSDFLLKTMFKLISIFIASSLVFLPIDIAKHSFKFSEDLILTGTGAHLWFLPSLAFGMVILWYIINLTRNYDLLPLISIVCAIPILLHYYSFGTKIQDFINLDFARFILSISFLSIGFYIAHSKIKLTLRYGIGMLLLSLLILYFEVEYFKVHNPNDVWSIQFLFSTILLSLAIFFLSFNCLNNKYLATLGRKYSLGIYLYHPFINMIVYNLILKIPASNSEFLLYINPFICFAVTLTILKVLDNGFPKVFKILNGDFTMKFNPVSGSSSN
jgi:surface polysaccharide O-acyltransferase-like enzyme